jgi:prephenate dehydrogenase
MRIGVYGLGRFGSFWARTLAQHAEVRAWSRDPAHATPAGVKRATEGDVLTQPAIFFCVAISAFEEVLARASPRIPAGTLVMDTCSVKCHPAAVMGRLLPPGVSALATHPMFGPDSAARSLDGLPMVLCPVRIGPDELELWRGFLASLGLSVSVMSPDEHDRQAAFTQGVTHYLGRVLKDLGVAPSPIGTVGYRRLLEIVEQTCNDPWQLFLDLQRFNPHTREMRERLGRSLDAVMAAIDGASHERDAGRAEGSGKGPGEGSGTTGT